MNAAFSRASCFEFALESPLQDPAVSQKDGHGSRRRRAGPGPTGPRQVDLEGRAVAGLAVDPDVALALLHDAVDGREAEAGALRLALRREEGLEDARLRLGVHPR